MAFNDFVFALKAFIGLDTSDYDKGIEESGGRLKKFGEGIKNGLGTAAKIGGAAIAAGSAAVVGFAKSALTAGQGFDTSMSQIAATLGFTTEDIANNVNGAGDAFQALRDKAQEMGAATNFSAQQAADGLNILAMSGFDAEESIAMIEDVLHLSAAGAMDMAQAAGYVSGAIKGFADDTKDAGYYADLMAKGATLANTSVAQLGDAMSSGAAGAAAYGQSADSMTVALLRLAEQGEVGAAAGTALSAAMKNLFTPSDQAAKALAELGVAAYDSSGNALDFNDVVNDLSAALSGMTAEEANAYKQTIFGIQGLDAFNKMTVTGVDKQQQWAEALASASDGMGEAAKQYATMTDNLQGDLDILSSSFDGLKLAVSDTLMASTREFVQFGSSALSAITAGFKEGGIDGAMEALGEQISAGLRMLVEKLPGLIEAGAKLVGAIGKALVDNAPVLFDAASTIIQRFAESLGDGESVRALVDGAVSILTELGKFLAKNAKILVDAAVKIIIALNEALYDPETLDTLVDGAIEVILALANALAEAAPKLAAAAPRIIGNIITALINNAPKLWEAGKELLKAIGQGIINYASTLWESVGSILGDVNEMTGGKLGEIASTIGTWWYDHILAPQQEFFGKIRELFTAFWDEHGTQITEALENIKQGFINIWENIKGALETAWNWIKETAENIWNALKEFWSTWGDTISTFFSGLWDTIKQVFKTVLDAIVDLFAIFSALFAGDWEKAWEETKRFFEDLWNNIVKIFENIWNTITSTLSELWEVVKEKVQGIWDTIKETISSAMDWLKELPAKALNWGRDLIQNFIGGIKEKWDNLKSTVSGVAGSIRDRVGFSEPKEGPLSDFHRYAPDMMELYAKGIRDNKYKVLDEIGDLTTSVQAGLTTKTVGAPRYDTQPIHITVQSVLDGKVIAETVTRYQRGRAVAMGV